MKKIALIVSGLLVSSVSFAGVAQLSGETTCHVYHKNKLLKTLTCSYDGASGAGASYAFEHYSYKLPGFGVMETAVENMGYDANGNSTGTDITLNGEPAVLRYRLSKSKKVVSQSYIEKNNLFDKALECYLSTKSDWEICA